MSFDSETMTGIQEEADRLSVEWQALAAVAEVESAGKPLWDGLCPIRIEGHYFHRLLPDDKRQTAVDRNLAHPNAGQIGNPGGMAERYRQLEQMILIDEDAALQSCSWGLGQVMGEHWRALGYDSVQRLAAEAQGSVAGQVRLMGRFIEHFGLADELRRKDWAAFARRYNGPGFAANAYDVKMAKAYDRFVQGSAAGAALNGAPEESLRRGDRGDAVKALQERLQALSYYRGALDGIFGGGTEIAVMDFQRDAKLKIDGVVGPITSAKLAMWTPERATQARARGVAEVVYKNQQAIRNRPCTPHLEKALAEAVYAVYGAGMQAQIYSGGQARKGTPGNRTGSIRHDDYGEGGRALDAWIVDRSGDRLTGVELARLGQYWLASKFGGCGLEMAVGGIHLDEWTTPPPGGGMYWMYPYAQNQPWGDKVAAMLVDGSRGIKP